MKYKIQIEPEALADIQDITTWYSQQQEGLGKKFQDLVIKKINGLSKNPHMCAVRYNQIRCLLIDKFPYMVHFYINQQTSIVEVLAVISTSRNPKMWEERT